MPADKESDFSTDESSDDTQQQLSDQARPNHDRLPPDSYPEKDSRTANRLDQYSRKAAAEGPNSEIASNRDELESKFMVKVQRLSFAIGKTFNTLRFDPFQRMTLAQLLAALAIQYFFLAILSVFLGSIFLIFCFAGIANSITLLFLSNRSPLAESLGQVKSKKHFDFPGAVFDTPGNMTQNELHQVDLSGRFEPVLNASYYHQLHTLAGYSDRVAIVRKLSHKLGAKPSRRFERHLLPQDRIVSEKAKAGDWHQEVMDKLLTDFVLSSDWISLDGTAAYLELHKNALWTRKGQDNSDNEIADCDTLLEALHRYSKSAFPYPSTTVQVHSNRGASRDENELGPQK